MYRKKNRLLLTALIVLTLCLPGIASANMTVKQVQGSTSPTGTVKIGEAQARTILENVFPEIFTGKKLQADYEEQNYMGRSGWHFENQERNNGPYEYGQQIEGFVDGENGEIVNMNYNPDADFYKGKGVKYTREQALQFAQTFLEKVQPDKLGMLKTSDVAYPFYYVHNNFNKHYMFSWTRVENGIGVDSDSIYIGVDAATGMITHYNLTWHTCEFPPLDKTLSREELTSKLVDQLGLYPSYVNVYGETESSLPAYVLNSSAAYYDCHTGQAISGDGSIIPDGDIRSYQQVFTPEKSSSQVAIPTTGNKISPEAAKKAAEEFFRSMGISGEVQRSGGGSSGGSGFLQEHWNFSIRQANNQYEDMNYMDVGIDVYTGQVMNFHNDTNRGIESSNNISEDKALLKATEAIEKVNPEKKDLVVLRKQSDYSDAQPSYYFEFARLANGIVVEQNGIRVEVNKSNGAINSYWVTWYPTEFTPLDKIISLEKATEVYKNQQPFELAYIFTRNSNNGYESSGQPILAYRNVEKNRVNAISGEVMGWRSEEKPAAVSDTYVGHWAGPVLSLLAENGLLPADGFKPDQEMTRRQVLRVLLTSLNGSFYVNDQDVSLALDDILSSDPDINVFKRAIAMDILSNQGRFGPDQLMKREDLAVWIVNGLGYQEIADMKNAISIPFVDADQILASRANYVGIIDGLGILGAKQDNYFRPQDGITWAEMATVASRLAFNISPRK